MKTGFWLRKEAGESFDFLKDPALKKEMDLMDVPYHFVNGLCHSFAAALKDIFGYEVEVIPGKDGSIIHAYAVHEGMYIDVRGINDDWDEFISEYDEVLPTHDRECLNIQTFEEYFKNEFDWDDPYDYTGIIAEDAIRIIEEHLEYYRIKEKG